MREEEGKKGRRKAKKRKSGLLIHSRAAFFAGGSWRLEFRCHIYYIAKFHTSDDPCGRA